MEKAVDWTSRYKSFDEILDCMQGANTSTKNILISHLIEMLAHPLPKEEKRTIQNILNRFHDNPLQRDNKIDNETILVAVIIEESTHAPSLFSTVAKYPVSDLPEWYKPLRPILEASDFLTMSIQFSEHKHKSTIFCEQLTPSTLAEWKVERERELIELSTIADVRLSRSDVFFYRPSLGTSEARYGGCDAGIADAICKLGELMKVEHIIWLKDAAPYKQFRATPEEI